MRAVLNLWPFSSQKSQHSPSPSLPPPQRDLSACLPLALSGNSTGEMGTAPLGEAGKARCPDIPLEHCHFSRSTLGAALFAVRIRHPMCFKMSFFQGRLAQPHQGLGRILGPHCPEWRLRDRESGLQAGGVERDLVSSWSGQHRLRAPQVS